MKFALQMMVVSLALPAWGCENARALDLEIQYQQGRFGTTYVSITNVSYDPSSVVEIDTVWINKRETDVCRIGLYKGKPGTGNIIYSKALAQEYGIGEEWKTPFVLKMGDNLAFPVQFCGDFVRYISVEVEGNWYDYEFSGQ